MINGLKILQAIKYRLWGRFPQLSYSRSGEDLILEEIFRTVGSGFYIDIGAYHPKKYSNTYKFYMNGWTGINIDANDDLIDLFQKHRPKDVNMFTAVSDVEEDKIFYKFKDDSSMNTISTDFANEALDKYGLKIHEQKNIKTKRLDTILTELNIERQIDFISIDVEGHDLEVLKSNDWERFRFKVVLIETDFNIYDINTQNNEVINFLHQNNYTLVAHTFINLKVGNLFFLDKSVAHNFGKGYL
ncbi:MAG: FkbM family methyltransferase [Bacteroidota bacterium]